MDNQILIFSKAYQKGKRNNNKKNKNLYKYLFGFLIILIIIIIIILLYKKLRDLFSENSDENIVNQQNMKLTINKTNTNTTNYNDISSKLKLLKIMTNNNILKYKGIENCLINDPEKEKCIYPFISPKNVVGKKRILAGTKSDGCYVILDDLADIKYAYSFGIEAKIQFDTYLANKGIDVYMYDHTINNLPYNNPKFHWQKIGICGKNNPTDKLKTLDTLISENGHTLEKNMILKIDVEHSEWDSLKDISSSVLNQFKYILIEFHFRYPNEEAQLYYDVLKLLYKTHQAFYLRCHGRNRTETFGNNRICRALEVSYINKNNNTFSKDESIYPIFEFDFEDPIIYQQEEFNLNILKLFDK